MGQLITLKYGEFLNIADLAIRYIGAPQLLDQNVEGFSIDSRTAQPGEIFLAIKGEKFDGHQFVPELIKKRKHIFFVADDWFASQNLTAENGNFFLVKDTTAALQKISRYYRLKFAIPVLAITGSNGKTTTKEMVFSVLSQQFNVQKNPGNLNNHIGLPLTLLKLTAAHQFAVTEMGTNHRGEIKTLAEIACPNFGLITNIGPAHLEFFSSLEGVFQAKNELWQYLEKKGEAAFINVDDVYLGKNIPAVKKIITYGIKQKANFQAKLIQIDDQGCATFEVDREKIKLSISGEHNVYNALAAYAVAAEFGLAPETIRQGLENFKPADKRMEMLSINDVRILNDCYNSNPESARKALTTLSQIHTTGRRIAVLGDMFELGKAAEQEHRAVGEFISSFNNINYLLTHGNLSRLTADSARKGSATQVRHFEQKTELISFLKSLLKPGDLVLIKGSRGMAMETVTQAIAQIK